LFVFGAYKRNKTTAVVKIICILLPKKQQEMNIIYYLLLYTFKPALPVSTALQRSECIPALATAPAQQQNQPGTHNPKNLLLLKKKTKDKEQD
jgi:hypothetical protein